MALIGGGNLVWLLSSYRMAWISGRFGSHKTSLAFNLAEPFLSDGYRLITNARSVWADKLEDVQLKEDGKLRAVVLLDEGGVYFKASRQIEMIASYARKMDSIYLIPSFWPPARAAQVVTIQALFNFISTGLPIVCYRWRAKLGSFEDKGIFFWWNPGEIYGVYSSNDPGDDPQDIISALIKYTEEYRQHWGHGLSKMEEYEPTEADYLTDAASSIQEAADQFASIPIRKRSRR